MKNKESHHDHPREPLQGEAAKQMKLIREQIAEIKVKLRKIQQESVAEMQKNFHTVFDTQNAASLANLSRQAQLLMKQMDEEANEPDSETGYPGVKNTDAPEMYPGYNAGRNALEIAKQRADHALKAASAGMKSAEQSLKNLTADDKPEK